MNELEHHGIKGQKWGVRNGPPYPLGEADKSSAEKKSSSKKTESSQENKSSAEKKSSSKKTESSQEEKQALKKEVDAYKRMADEIVEKLNNTPSNTVQYADLLAQLLNTVGRMALTKRRLKEIDEEVEHSADITLEHHGILGQKHGVRNGPPYPLSRAKHNKVVKSAGSRSSISDLSDADLNKVVERLKLEAKYKEYMDDLNKAPKKKKSAASKILEESAQKAIKDVASQTMKYALGTAINQVSGRKIIQIADQKSK